MRGVSNRGWPIWRPPIRTARGEFAERATQGDSRADEDGPCPALDPEAGTCDLYAARPITCRAFGPPVRCGEEAVGVCELVLRRRDRRRNRCVRSRDRPRQSGGSAASQGGRTEHNGSRSPGVAPSLCGVRPNFGARRIDAHFRNFGLVIQRQRAEPVSDKLMLLDGYYSSAGIAPEHLPQNQQLHLSCLI